MSRFFVFHKKIISITRLFYYSSLNFVSYVLTQYKTRQDLEILAVHHYETCNIISNISTLYCYLLFHFRLTSFHFRLTSFHFRLTSFHFHLLTSSSACLCSTNFFPISLDLYVLVVLFE